MRPFHNSILVIFCSLFLNSCSENNDFENTKVSKNESDVQTNSDNSDNNDTGTESAGFIISAISGVTDETGTTATFTIKLKTQPLANVSISVSSSDATEGSVNPSS